MSHCSQLSLKPFRASCLSVSGCKGAHPSWDRSLSSTGHIACSCLGDCTALALLPLHIPSVIVGGLKINTCHWPKGWRTFLGYPELPWRFEKSLPTLGCLAAKAHSNLPERCWCDAWIAGAFLRVTAGTVLEMDHPSRSHGSWEYANLPVSICEY